MTVKKHLFITSIALNIQFFTRVPTVFFRVLGLVLLLPFIAPQAYAVQVSNIYQALLPVDDQTDSERDAGVKKGLERVLVKVSGDSSLLSRPQVVSALQNARRYVSEVGYSQISVPGEEKPVLALSASYSQQQVDRLLRREQLQIWPASRHELLVWVVVDTVEDGKRHVGDDFYPNLLQSLEYHMARRGAPLLEPQMDLQDRLVLPALEAWAFNREQLPAAAARYGVDNWMVIRLYQTSQGQWRGNSWLNTLGKKELQSFTEANPDNLIAKAVDRAVDKLAKNYAFVPQLQEEPIALALENIRSFEDFNAATVYLESLEVVRKVQIESVDAHRLSLQIIVDGDVKLLLDTLYRNPRFQQLTDHTLLAAPRRHRFSWSSQ